MTPTKKDINTAITELHEAMLECNEADIAETNIKLAKQKAHKRLSLARDEVRALSFTM
jgi:hypothetical protein